jgi:hypothetical protein
VIPQRLGRRCGRPVPPDTSWLPEGESLPGSSREDAASVEVSLENLPTCQRFS